MLSARRARQLFAIHRWTGLLAGLVILFLSVTGAALVFIDEIDEAMYPSLLTSAPGDERVSPDRALAAVRDAYPDATVNRVELPRDDGSVYVMMTGMVDGPERFNQVMVDPYTGMVTGTRHMQASLPFILRQIHLRFFYFGWKGRVVVGFFGLVLLISCVTGFFIYGRFIRALPRWWSIRRDRGFQISTSDWHKLVGIVSLVFNLVIAVTGAVLGLENLSRFSDTVQEAIHPAPGPEARADLPVSLEAAIPLSHALAGAEGALAGFVPTAVNLPRAERSHYVVYGNTNPVAMAGASTVHVHALTGQVLHRHDESAARVVTQAYNWMDPLHFGNWGGVWSKLLYLVFGLTTAFLAISGFIVWYMKKRRRTRRPAAAPRREAAASA